MQYKRKKLNLNVNRQFQMWLLARILGTVILSSLVAACILYFYARQETTASFYEAHIKIRRVSDLLLPVIAAGSLVSLVSGTLLALFLPQKIAGPLYRVEQELAAVQKGDLTVVIKLRGRDTLQDLADSINETIAGLRKKVQAIKDAHGQLDQVLPKDRAAETVKALEHEKQCLDSLIT